MNTEPHMYGSIVSVICCSGLENLIKSQKDKLAELQEYLRAKEADLEKVVPTEYQATIKLHNYVCLLRSRSCLVTLRMSWMQKSKSWRKQPLSSTLLKRNCFVLKR